MKLLMNNLPKNCLLAVLCAAGLIVSSCSTVSDLVSTGAQAAANAGVIDSGMAESISNSSQAIAKAAENITPEQEYYLGRAVAGKILGNYKRYTSAALESYMNKICMAMVINSDEPQPFNGYHVALLDSDQINALSTPGGHILVTRGLVNCTDSEDALAAVIAHEISHIQLKHAVKSIKSSRAANAIIATASTAAKALSSKELNELTEAFGETVDSVVNTLVDSGYSKKAEFEADAHALELMAAAGYNPAAMNTMLHLLHDKLGSANTGFGKTHPSPAERIQKVTPLISAYKTADTSAKRKARYTKAVAGI